MCGIFGYLGPRFRDPTLSEMTSLMAHRGPDHQGQYTDIGCQLFLGHRRLSILDTSERANQPMISNDDDHVLILNGEIYNFQELRSQLDIPFQTTSDTEVLLQALIKWGIQKTLEAVNGMFSFAYFKRQDKKLYLARDRVGKKPLYYTSQNRELMFSSELKSITRSKFFPNTIRAGSLEYYLRFMSMPSGASIFENVHQVLPGHYLEVDAELNIFAHQYWSIQDHALQKSLNTYPDMDAALEDFVPIFHDAVRLRMISDVPLGLFLSSGIDSTAVCTAASLISDSPIHTYTIGFNEKSHDESSMASQFARVLKTEHHQDVHDPGSMQDLILELPKYFDEPMADVGALPFYMLCNWARGSATVCLAGDGGDELFGGYPRYFWANRILKLQSMLGKSGAGLLGKSLQKLPINMLETPPFSGLFSSLRGSEGLAHRVYRLGEYLQSDSSRYYMGLGSVWDKPSQILNQAEESSFSHDIYMAISKQSSDLDWSLQMMMIDQKRYLVEDILTKVDRMSMACSLEVRAPLLDYRLIEWSWKLPFEYKCSPSGDQGKLILRHYLKKNLPCSFERPKIGFGVPLTKWLRKDLYKFASDVLLDQASHDFFHRKVLEKTLEEHRQGKSDHARRLWTIIAFNLWYQEYMQ